MICTEGQPLLSCDLLFAALSSHRFRYCAFLYVSAMSAIVSS